MLNAIWGLAGVLVGATICFAAVFYATKRNQTQAIRLANWDKRVELYIGIDRYMQEVQNYLVAVSEGMDSETDVSELFRRLRIASRSLYNYINDNRGEIDLYLPTNIGTRVFDAQVLSNLNISTAEEIEVYWDKKNVDLVANHIDATMQLIKKDMKLYT